MHLQTPIGAWKQCAPVANLTAVGIAPLAAGGYSLREPIVTPQGVECQLPLSYHGVKVGRLGAGTSAARLTV